MGPIQVTPTIIVKSYEEARKLHNMWVAQGFEGAMLKNLNGIYTYGYRSDDLEKMKEFLEDEFEIIGGKEGTGLDTGCIVHRCKTEEGNEFDVRSKGTVEERQRMFQELNDTIGKLLIVRFPEYTDSRIPVQPVGVAIRDYE